MTPDLDTKQPTVAMIRYRGVRRDGRGACGASEAMSAEQLTCDLFDKGWRRAVLTASDGRQVGGITKEGARRIWWAEP